MGKLRGYRTYILGWLMVVTVMAQWLVGDITFWQVIQQLPELLGAMGLITLRAAVGNLPSRDAP